MSVQWITWVYGGRVGTTKIPALAGPKNSNRLVLLALANHANDSGESWPSKETLAAEAGLSLRTTDIAVAWLRDNGYVRVMKNGGPQTSLGNRTNRYLLVAEVEQTPQISDPADFDVQTPQISTADPADFSGGTVSEPSGEPSGRDAYASDDEFLSFWSIYPKTAKKKQTFSAWRRLPKTKREAAIAGARVAAELVRGGADPQFIPDPSTFINGERWEDSKFSSASPAKKATAKSKGIRWEGAGA